MNNQAPFDMQKAFAAAQEILDAYPTLCLHGFGLHNQDAKPMTQQVAELANQRTRLRSRLPAHHPCHHRMDQRQPAPGG